MPKITQQTGGKQPKRKPSGTSVLDRIKPIQDFEDTGIKICGYGKSGTGKTTLHSTFPKPSLVAICSGAGETKSIKTTPGIDAVALENEAELWDLIELQRSTGKYKTFVLDHASGYQDLVLKKILNKEELPAQMAWGTATQQEWGQLGLRMKDVLRDMLALECNVFIVAQEREFNNEGDSNGVLAPYVNCALSPSVAGWLGPAVDYLVETFLRMQVVKKTVRVNNQTIERMEETGKVEFCLRTAPHPVYATKFRLPKGTPLPDAIVNPDYTSIMKLINGGK